MLKFKFFGQGMKIGVYLSFCHGQKSWTGMRSRDSIFALHCVTKRHNVYRIQCEKRYKINPTSLTE